MGQNENKPIGGWLRNIHSWLGNRLPQFSVVCPPSPYRVDEPLISADSVPKSSHV